MLGKITNWLWPQREEVVRIIKNPDQKSISDTQFDKRTADTTLGVRNPKFRPQTKVENIFSPELTDANKLVIRLENEVRTMYLIPRSTEDIDAFFDSAEKAYDAILLADNAIKYYKNEKPEETSKLQERLDPAIQTFINEYVSFFSNPGIKASLATHGKGEAINALTKKSIRLHEENTQLLFKNNEKIKIKLEEIKKQFKEAA